MTRSGRSCPAGAARGRRCRGVRVPPARAGGVTFSETIAPILYENCVTCHRPGEAAPFSLITYEDVEEEGQADRQGHGVALHAALARRARLRRIRRRAPPDRRADRDDRRMGQAGHAAGRSRRRCRSCRSSPRAGTWARPTSSLKMPAGLRAAGERTGHLPQFRDPDAPRPRTSGCAPSSSARARARPCTTCCSPTTPAARRRSATAATASPDSAAWARPASAASAAAPGRSADGRSARRRCSCPTAWRCRCRRDPTSSCRCTSI